MEKNNYPVGGYDILTEYDELIDRYQKFLDDLEEFEEEQEDDDDTVFTP